MSGSIRVQVRVSGRMLAVALAAAVAGCESVNDTGSNVFGTGPGVEAPLAPKGGSASTGNAKFVPYDGGVTMLVSFNGAVAGEYRVVIHANGNCTSPNAFSAGAPWAPSGTTVPPLIRQVVANSNGTAIMTTRIAGLRIDGPEGINGKSVVIHDGALGPLDAQPGIPNNRIACGVIGPLRSIF